MDGQVDPKEFDRLPPFDIEAEQCTISALAMGDDAVRAEVRSIVKADDFYQADHQTFYRILCEMVDRGDNVDHVLLRAELAKRKLLEECGGTAYIAQLIAAIPLPKHGPHYAKIVASHSRTRAWIALAGEITRQAYSATKAEDASALIRERVAAALDSIEQTGGKTTEITTIAEVLHRVNEQLSAPAGTRLIETGIWSLDQQTGGLGVGEMTLVAARPSMGKSLLAKQIARNIACRNVAVGLVSVEESADKVGRNIVSAIDSIENHNLRKGLLSEAERQKVRVTAEAAKEIPLYINDTASRLSDVVAVITKMAKVRGCRVIVVDYLQLIESEGGNTREQEVSRISRRLKTVFKQLGVAGLVVAQLNRGNEQGQIRPPRMSDLRDSGQIEQDADVILLLHRPGYYARENAGDQKDEFAAEDRRCFVIPAKNRDGSRQEDIVLEAELQYQRFRDPSEPRDPFQ